MLKFAIYVSVMSMAIETNQVASDVSFMTLRDNTEGLIYVDDGSCAIPIIILYNYLSNKIYLLSVGTISNTVFVVYCVTLIYFLQGQLQTQC